MKVIQYISISLKPQPIHTQWGYKDGRKTNTQMIGITTAEGYPLTLGVTILKTNIPIGHKSIKSYVG